VVVVSGYLLLYELLRALLQGDGYIVVPCRDGATAPGCVREARPHAIVLDLYRASGDAGWALLGQITAGPEVARVPLIVCTDDRRGAARHAGTVRRLGATVLLKPFEPAELVALVRQAVERPAGS
jgi:DNA-binding response OmpR family regulator